MVKTLREEGLYFLTLLMESIRQLWSARGKLAKCDLTSLNPKLSCSYDSNHKITNRWTGLALGSSISSLGSDKWESISTDSLLSCSRAHLLKSLWPERPWRVMCSHPTWPLLTRITSSCLLSKYPDPTFPSRPGLILFQDDFTAVAAYEYSLPSPELQESCQESIQWELTISCLAISFILYYLPHRI